MIQGECEKCDDRGEEHGLNCIVRKVIFSRDFKSRGPFLSRQEALERAVAAIDIHINKQIERKHMSNLVIKNETTSVSLAQKFGFTDSQLDLVKRTVAKNATNDELELFFYRCKELQLNPLMPGQVYFLKFGSNPGTVIVGLDGFRSRAQRTGKLAGIKRGVIRNDKGQCIGGWADVYRKDWDHPAHEEVALNEYADLKKPTWRDMPETMIKKVAEVAALRMAFPEELGGVYSGEEMDRASSSHSVKDVESKVEPTKPMATKEDLAHLSTVAKANGVSSKEELKKLVFEWYGHKFLTDLTFEELIDMCADLEEKKQIEGSGQPVVIKPVEKATVCDTVDESDIPEFPEADGVSNDVPWAKYRE